MTQSDDIAVIAELNRIVARYGPDSLIRLASLIRDPQRAEELATVLESAAAQAPRAKARTAPKPRKTNGVGMGILNSLKASDPQKHAVLADFREHLISGSLLRSMNEIRQFARSHDLAIGKSSSRNTAIAPLLRSIAELETPAIISLLDSMTKLGADDRSLERWRDLIVKPRP